MLRPKLFDTLKSYTRKQFFADLMAGSIVGIVALPLAIAFAIASGVTPERGLYTAIIAGFIISVLGGSRVQIGGPTGAFVVIIYGIVQQYGVDGLMIATMMAGIMLIAMGLFRLGSVIKFIPYPVVVGFTTGIAVIIFSSQMTDLLGLKIHALPADFIEKWIVIGSHLGATDLYSLALALGVIFITVFWGKVTTKIPGPFVAIVLSSVAVVWLQLPVETIGSRFGEIPHSLPLPSLPHIQWGMIKQLIQPAITIALLAGIEALLSAVVADGMISGKHRSNMELVAQGTANFFSPLFGGIPATGAIARTATNIKNGGRTPVAGIFHAVVLLAIMLLFGKWAVHIPLAGLAGIMVVVAYNMSEWRSFRALAHGRRSDAAVLLVTFGLTVIIDLTFALQVGILIAGILFLRSMTSSANVTAITKSMDEDGDMDDLSSFAMSPIPDGVKVYEISGPMFFGAAYKFKEALAVVDKPPRVIIIRMRNVPVIDATGERALEDVFAMFRKRGTEFVISGLQPQARTTLTVAGLIDKIGEENIQPTFDDALLRARALLQKPAHKGATS
ncbi:MAG: SulP family inorganic anion transporter [Candidatus Zixiibacteriota bacterium]